MSMESVSGRQFCRFAENMEGSGTVLSEAENTGLSREEILYLYSEYAGSVYNFFYYSTGDREASMDLVNDVFVKVLDKSPTFDHRKGNIKVWLFTVARNTLRDYLRFRRRVKPCLSIDDALELPAPEHSDPEAAAALKADIMSLTQALEALNKRERSLIALKYGAGFRNKDMARLTGMSEKHVGVILCRALSKLRKHLMMGDEIDV
ncbi:MAG: sigma-70 family RNA polymerase sigma factor [Clostridiaceae bacterium]|nr:sigma-70 family RNA polymerase sigma factor [Clostridiaceae bacterium]